MRTSRFPSYAVSAILHLALFVAAYVTWPLWSKKVDFTQNAVPITIVTSAPVADVRPAEKAEQVQTAAAPEPEETPQPAPPAPQPAPQPKPAPPPPPAPTPKPLPQSTPKPSTAQPKAKPQELNLDQLAAAPNTRTAKPTPKSTPLNLTALAAASPKGAKSNAPRGAARPETDLLARLAVGRATALSGDAMSALKAKLGRLWNPNCGVEGAGNVVIKVEMRLTSQRLVGFPAGGDQQNRDPG